MDTRNHQAHTDRLVPRGDIERYVQLGMRIGNALEAIGRFASGLLHPPRPTPHELRHNP